MEKILIVGPTFFGYRSAVAAELRAMGMAVTEIDDRPSESILFKSAAKVGFRVLEMMIGDYADRLSAMLRVGNYDRVIYLGGMSFCFNRSQIAKLRSCTNARFVAALWDSMENCRRFKTCLSFFDHVYSFDFDDCQRYGMEFRPLFYLKCYSELPGRLPEEEFKYDACFVGSVHQPSKFKAVLEINRALELQGLRVFAYYYLPSKSIELYRKIASRATYRGIKFQHRALAPSQIAEIFSKSRAIVDAPQLRQSGLTIRSIEAVGASRKLITTNQSISKYSFYEYGNVYIWDGTALPESRFFAEPYCDLPRSIYDAYSVRSFALALLEEGDSFVL